jgi:CHAD domain-containing protein
MSHKKRRKRKDGSKGQLTVVARDALRKSLAKVATNLRRTAKRTPGNVEYVHQLRVWSRRATAAVTVFRELLEKKHVDWFKKNLKKLRRAADDARDCDVMAERLSDDPAAQRVLAEIEEHRQKAQKPIAAAWQHMNAHNRFKGHVEWLLARLENPNRKAVRKQQPFKPWAAARLRPLVDEFFASGCADLSSAKGLHRLRIQSKKLRYAMELLTQAIAPDFQDKAYPAVKRIQEQLGEINDLAVAAEKFRNWMREAGSDEEAEFFRRLAETEQSEFEQKRGEFLAWWSDARRWRLRRRFDKLLCDAANCNAKDT